jgi:hypothetical protein
MQVDLTADVDFANLKRAVEPMAEEGHGLACFGPVGQGYFLHHMGCSARLEQLLESPDLSDDAAEAMVDGYTRLVDGEQMGTRYKVLALVDGVQAKSSGPPPGGFVEDPATKKKPTAGRKGTPSTASAATSIHMGSVDGDGGRIMK